MTQRSAEQVGAGLTEAQKSVMLDKPIETDILRTLLALKRKGLMTHGGLGGPDSHYRLTPLGLAVRALITPPAEDEQP